MLSPLGYDISYMKSSDAKRPTSTIEKNELALVRHLHSNVFLVLKGLVADGSTSI